MREEWRKDGESLEKGEWRQPNIYCHVLIFIVSLDCLFLLILPHIFSCVGVGESLGSGLLTTTCTTYIHRTCNLHTYMEIHVHSTLAKAEVGRKER